LAEHCSWCGADVEAGDGFRVYEAVGARKAVFCRLEHVVPWGLQGAHWEAGEMTEPPSIDEGPISCSLCDRSLDEIHVLLVRHRGDHRIADDFCGVDHLVSWAKSGGRYA
jgi:hypothetical protein